MSALSKFGTSTARKIIGLPALGCAGGGLGRATAVCIVRHGHGHVFRRRQGQLTWNRAKDQWHFYIVGVGLIPCILILFFTHVIYGTCELMEYPTEGPPPRYWQFERTPLRQFFTWLMGDPDMKYTEGNMSILGRMEIKNLWRALESRVKHLQSERMDYKGYYYHPLTNQWLEYSKKRAANTFHYTTHYAKMHTNRVH